jgi:hypothetical protein
VSWALVTEDGAVSWALVTEDGAVSWALVTWALDWLEYGPLPLRDGGGKIPGAGTCELLFMAQLRPRCPIEIFPSISAARMAHAHPINRRTEARRREASC